MKSLLFLLITSSFCFAQDLIDPGFQKFEHQNPGCPINSECSPASGMLLQKWTKMLDANPRNLAEAINKFQKKHGSPIQVLAKKSIYQTDDPILWNSRCPLHNPKNPNEAVFRGLLFIKNKLQHKVAKFGMVSLFEGESKIDYSIPYGDQVTLIKNNSLVILKDFEDHFYKIAVKPDGSFQAVDIPSKLINKALAKKIKDHPCPVKQTADGTYFSQVYCQKVLDLDTNQLKTIQLSWACP